MNYRHVQNFKLLTIFIIAFSLATLAGPLSSRFQLPTIPSVAAIPQNPCHVTFPTGGCSDYWVPAGAAEDTLVATIFTSDQAEFLNIQSSSPSIDLTDSPLPPPTVFCDICQNPAFQITSAINEAGYVEIQFMLANNFWGCNFNFGNSTCGVQIRQGIAHMIDTANFARNQPNIAGQAEALDAPVPTDNVGGLPPANPCGWDSSFPQSGSNCILGSPGGTAYHLANATGANGISWLQAPGSKDLNAAAQHFVNAGIASGFNATTSILTGINPAASSHAPGFLNFEGATQVQMDLHNALQEQICYLFTGSYSACQYLTSFVGAPISPFPGFTTSTTTVNLSWGIYIAAYQSPSGPSPFDNSLYFQYDSKFVSGIPSIQSPSGLCSSAAVPTSSASDYMYLCDPIYDSLANQIESASSLTSAASFGEQAENRFGSHAYTIPIFERSDQFAIPNNGWTRVVNGIGTGSPNYFTSLGAWNPTPPVSGTIRQGLARTTSSVNPFLIRGRWDSYVVGTIYDTLAVENPLASGQLIFWATLAIQQLPLSAITYVPPPNTTQSFRFTLRNDLFFQDGQKVTSFDVAFSYLALKGTGALAGAGAAPMTGVTILGLTQFDINLSGVGPFTLSSLTSLPILPGSYWSNAGSSVWTRAIGTCSLNNAACYPAQYTIVPPAPTTTACALTCTFPASDMNVNVARTSPFYDPLANHALVGSGPFECGPVTSSGSSTTCSTSSAENPPVGGSYTLTRFGKGLSPASSIQSIYFRSNGNLALYLWSLDTGDITQDFLDFSFIGSCFGVPVTSTGPCAHFQQGLGAPSGGGPVGLSQVAIVNRFVGLNWVAPFNWHTSPPLGIVPLNPVLYENTLVLNPASVAGCSSPYPTGGYDC